MSIRNPRDFAAGLLFMAFGLVALVTSASYAAGSASRMGPGYMPRALGVLLLVFGAVLALRGLRERGEPATRWRVGPLVIVLASVAFFSLAAKWLGVIVATIALVFLASTASREFRWREALLSGAIVGVTAVAVFVYGLGVPLPVWPAFVGGR